MPQPKLTEKLARAILIKKGIDPDRGLTRFPDCTSAKIWEWLVHFSNKECGKG